MVDFKLRQISLQKKHKYFLPLPKLNGAQLEILLERLINLGFKLRAGSNVKATLGSNVVWLRGAGIAYSNSDLIDPIGPIIPKLFEVGKTRVTPQSLAEMYYSTKRDGERLRIRFNPRIESFSTWRELRFVDESGLTPDEALVLKTLLRHARGRIRVIADYPSDTARVVQIGRRVYFDSSLEVEEFVSNIRVLGERNQRNTFLPQNCMLDLVNFKLPRVNELRRLSEELGEWCYYSISV